MAVRLQLRRRRKGIDVPSRVSAAPNAFRLTASVVVASGDMNSLYARRRKANSPIANAIKSAKRSRPSARYNNDAPASFGRVPQRNRAGFHLPTKGSEPPANDVEGRREDQSERRNTDHAGEDRGAERQPELGPSAGRPNQWHDTENEGERGHQDRPEPQPRGCNGGGPALTAPVLELLGELDDQDRMLRRETNQHNEADLGEDVVILSAQEHAGDRGNEAHGHDEDHRQRQGQTLILSGQNQKYENHRQHEGKNRSIARPYLLEGERCPLIREAVGQRLGGELLHALDSLALRVPGGRCAVELSGGIEIVAGHAVGPRFVADGG